MRSMSLVARLVLLVWSLLQLGNSASTNLCRHACNELRASLPASQVSTAPGASDYWAAQVEHIAARCYVEPASTKEVALVLKAAQKYQCPFAVRGSGHSDVAGASNIANGIVLNLARFQEVKLSADRTYATIGAGNQWGSVYKKLDKFNYTVVGGRETTVGVGGLTLGGGVSFFSGQYGFACDNVLRYEAVLADGSVVDASPSSAPDLYKALRGGGNNFAVVTRFDLAAYAYTLMQGGLTVWRDSAATTASQIDAFVDFAHTGQQDPHAALFMSLVNVEGAYAWIDGLYYTLPSPAVAAAPVYAPFFTAQLNASRVASTSRRATHAELAAELGRSQPAGSREQFHTGTYVADARLLARIVAIYRDVVAKTQRTLLARSAAAPDVLAAALAFQPITRNILAAQRARGGNVLGLGAARPDTPLMLLSMSWPWRDAANDDVFVGAMAEIVRRSNAAAREMGLFDEFIYMNYAATGEKVVQSYGADNVAFMRRVSAAYDPHAVFQKLAPGGFKLP